jgi:hypothetical protein
MRTLARQRDRTELLARLRTVDADSPRRWGRMSAHQMVCHVADALRLITGQKPAGRAPRLHERTVLKWVVLYVPLRWPAGILTSPGLDQEQGGTRPVDFEADVAEVEALLERVLQSPNSSERLTHPVFGRMTHAAWLRWAYLHTDHHLRQFGA